MRQDVGAFVLMSVIAVLAPILSVLLFPLIALRLRGESAPAARPGARAESW
ncbi:MAG TPA: hypothetical protein VFN97_04545 [Actinospica sp.]|nr:hypothetical protein [Actinospica sp.]